VKSALRALVIYWMLFAPGPSMEMTGIALALASVILFHYRYVRGRGQRSAWAQTGFVAAFTGLGLLAAIPMLVGGAWPLR